MRLPLQVSFRNMDPSPVIEETVRDRAVRLDRFCDHVTSCRVGIDVPHRHHQSGNQYAVRLDITVPGCEFTVNRVGADHVEARDLTAAVRQAFATAGRLLEDYVRRRRRQVKRHEPRPHARVRAVAAGRDHGFLETADGREVYFHENSLLNADFDTLTLGPEVTFAEEPGEKGPQATSVRVVGRPGHL